VSVDAKVDAGFQAGFLGVNFAGSIGTDITIETGYSSSGTAPWRDYWPTGTAYKIVDSAGKQMVYVQSYKSALYSSESTTEQLTRDQGESRAVANGAYPFVHVAAYHNNTYTYTLTVTVTVDVEFSVGHRRIADGSSGVEFGQSQSVQAKYIKIGSPVEKCFVVYVDGLEIHSWYRKRRRLSVLISCDGHASRLDSPTPMSVGFAPEFLRKGSS